MVFCQGESRPSSTYPPGHKACNGNALGATEGGEEPTCAAIAIVRSVEKPTTETRGAVRTIHCRSPRPSLPALPPQGLGLRQRSAESTGGAGGEPARLLLRTPRDPGIGSGWSPQSRQRPLLPHYLSRVILELRARAQTTRQCLQHPCTAKPGRFRGVSAPGPTDVDLCAWREDTRRCRRRQVQSSRPGARGGALAGCR